MFYPFRSLAGLTIEGSYWEFFSQELQRYLEHKDTISWHKGFDILQNINDRMTLEKELKWAKDPICWQPKTKSLIPSLNKRSGKKKIMRQKYITNVFTFKVNESIFSVERSNYLIQEYIVHHWYITTATMSGVVLTTMTILMTYYAAKNYCIQRSLTDANLVMVIF